MPRTTMGTPSWMRKAQAEKAEDEICNQAMKWTIRKKMSMKGLSPEYIVNAVDSPGMTHPGTFRQKTCHTQRFTLMELRRLFRLLEFSDEEILESMRVKQ